MKINRQIHAEFERQHIVVLLLKFSIFQIHYRTLYIICANGTHSRRFLAGIFLNQQMVARKKHSGMAFHNKTHLF